MRTLNRNNDIIMRGGTRATLDMKSRRRTILNGLENDAFHQEQEDSEVLVTQNNESDVEDASAIVMQELRSSERKVNQEE